MVTEYRFGNFSESDGSGESEPVLDRLEGLMGDNSWLPPAALYFIRDITGQLEVKAQSSLLSDKINKLKQSVEKELLNLERIVTLKAFVTGWMSRRNSSLQANEFLTWEAYGDIPWLVGVCGDPEGKGQYLLSFHGPEVLSSVIEKGGLSETFPGSCLLVTGHDPEGILPGRPFQGFRLRFEETGISAWSRYSLPFPILYCGWIHWLWDVSALA